MMPTQYSMYTGNDCDMPDGATIEYVYETVSNNGSTSPGANSLTHSAVDSCYFNEAANAFLFPGDNGADAVTAAAAMRKFVNKLGGIYMSGKPLSLNVRRQIIAMAEMGMKACDISRQLQISHGCVSKIISKWRATGSFEPRRIGGSKPKKTLPEVVAAVRMYKRACPTIHSLEIRRRLLADDVCTDQNVPSLSSINRIIRMKLRDDVAEFEASAVRDLMAILTSQTSDQPGDNENPKIEKDTTEEQCFEQKPYVKNEIIDYAACAQSAQPFSFETARAPALQQTTPGSHSAKTSEGANLNLNQADVDAFPTADDDDFAINFTQYFQQDITSSKAGVPNFDAPFFIAQQQQPEVAFATRMDLHRFDSLCDGMGDPFDCAPKKYSSNSYDSSACSSYTDGSTSASASPSFLDRSPFDFSPRNNEYNHMNHNAQEACFNFDNTDNDLWSWLDQLP